MPIQCPTCSRINPEDAAYCYYDGRGLTDEARSGPMGSGTQPFPMPFGFADGHGCSNFNQLVLACDSHWNEACSYLANGTWKSFFTAIGRVDLAILATPSAHPTDPDVALCDFLFRLPADAEALRPPRLTLPTTEEDLGALEAGADCKFQLVIENQGMLLLRGSATTECDWLAFRDGQGSAPTKLFQTRDTYTLPVLVLGSKLRASKLPLEGEIVIDTNGGRQVVTVRATVPIRPFPRGPEGRNVLTGAMSSREIAVKARAHPDEASALFEQGVVRAWYASNGWAYPIRGTQARGRGALQQFFEALGLTKPPALEINTDRIVCEGEVGKQLMKKVIVRTAEARPVYAEAFSTEEWITVLPAQAHGNSVTVPIRIQIPPRPGETLNAIVTFIGNGQQQFIVPVTLLVTYDPVAVEKQRAARERWMWIMAGGVVLTALAVAIALVVNHRRSRPTTPPEESKSILVVEIDVPNADVYVDGSRMAVTWEEGTFGKRAELHIEPGSHWVAIKKDGIPVVSEEMQLQAGERRILTARVGRVPSTGDGTRKPDPGPDRKEPERPGDKPVSSNEKVRPALLDCTTKDGVDAAEMHKAQEAWASYLGRPVEETVEVDKGVKMTFILIPPGKFLMGSAREEQDYVTKTFYDGKRPAWLDDEAVHVVTLTEPFYLGKYEVTQAQYEALTGKHPSQFNGPDLPVENVSWDEARAFAALLTRWRSQKPRYRLPKEAEWEYACRGGRPSSQPFGIKDGYSLSSRDTNFDGSFSYGGADKGPSLQKTCVVGSYTANALGLHDMHGNVQEWCSDRYGPYPEGPVTNPTGPAEGSERVIRGGGWDLNAGICRSANRTWSVPDNRVSILGFRLAHGVP